MNLSSLTGGKIKLNIEIEPENLSFYLKRISHALYTTENLRTKFRKFSLLTAQERKVLHLLVKGYYSKEIAQILYISIETVKTHRKNISKKLEAHSAAELSYYYSFLYVVVLFRFLDRHVESNKRQCPGFLELAISHQHLTNIIPKEKETILAQAPCYLFVPYSLLLFFRFIL